MNEKIKLLNGEEWDKEEILKRMEDDSFYYGHLGQYALSSSSLKKLLQSPRAYRNSLRYSDNSSQALRDGRLVHLSILEPEKVKDLIVIEGTKAKKEYKDAVAEHGDHMVYTESEMNNAFWIADAVLKNNEASFLLQGCDYEISGVDMIEDIAFRAKADAISKDRSVIVDLKTTSANIEDWKWEAKKYNYGLQAALYMHIFNSIEFIFLVVNKSTKDIGIFDCSSSLIEKGQEDFYRAIDIYKEYFTKDNSNELIDNYVFRGLL